MYVMENGVREDLFEPLDKGVCRERLNLPRSSQIIGTAGAIFRNRGIATLFEAFERLKPKYPDLRLALAGPRDIGIPRSPGIIDLGILPLEKVPLLLNALDVAIICNRENDFGRYCFPQKAREIMACRIPLVAARVGSMKDLFKDCPERLYAPDSSHSLAQAIEKRLEDQRTDYETVPEWSDLALRLDTVFKSVASRKRR